MRRTIPMMANQIRKYIDIGANLCDSMYSGVYHGSKKHEPDVADVISRASEGGLERIIITGTNLKESEEALKMAIGNEMLYSTVGCHPTYCNEFKEAPDEYLEKLLTVINSERERSSSSSSHSRIVAVGECGLDYARTNFCDKDTQKLYFEKQLTLAQVSGLPLFLHCRDAAEDLLEILGRWRERIHGGVVHSFDGTSDELKSFLDMDLYIGINGCSLKTEQNLKVAAEIPLGRLMIETDSPWCEVKASHAGYKHVSTTFSSLTKKKEKWAKGCMVKGRNEPHCIVQVLEVLSGIREEPIDVLANAVYENSMKLFFPSNK